ncbi:PLDc N-terminal domain-containing protein [Saccharomonospora sp. NPDC006951]
MSKHRAPVTAQEQPADNDATALIDAAAARKVRWQQLSGPKRMLLIVATAVQFGLAGLAWADLARRKPAEVKGPKRIWGLVIGINFIGPIAYLRFGRKTADTD